MSERDEKLGVYRECWLKEKPLRELRQCLWQGLFREYVQGLVEREDLGISPWSLVVAKVPGSRIALETRVDTPPGLWWMAAAKLDDLGIPHVPSAYGSCAVRDPVEQVDLLYHVGRLKVEFVSWALLYLTGRKPESKVHHVELVMRAYESEYRKKEQRERDIKSSRKAKFLAFQAAHRRRSEWGNGEHTPQVRFYEPPKRLRGK